MEMSVEKSQEQAEIIKMIQIPVIMLDVEYCKELAKDMLSRASRQETIAVLNPSHPQIKNDILREQGKALGLLCGYVEALKEVDRLQKLSQKESETRRQIEKLFL